MSCSTASPTSVRADIPVATTTTKNPWLTESVDKNEAKEQFKKLIRALSDVGLQTEVRPGTDQSLLVFVKAQEKYLGKAVYRSRYVKLLTYKFIVLFLI